MQLLCWRTEPVGVRAGDRFARRGEVAVWSDQGLGEAWYWLGNVIWAKGDPIPYYAKAAELGYDKAFEYLLDDLLFRAGEKADVAQAKKFGDLVRQRSINLGSGTAAMLDTIDRCFAAGKPAIPASDLPTAAERQRSRRGLRAVAVAGSSAAAIASTARAGCRRKSRTGGSPRFMRRLGRAPESQTGGRADLPGSDVPAGSSTWCGSWMTVATPRCSASFPVLRPRLERHEPGPLCDAGLRAGRREP
jgi:hypothetical protein